MQMGPGGTSLLGKDLIYIVDAALLIELSN